MKAIPIAVPYDCMTRLPSVTRAATGLGTGMARRLEAEDGPRWFERIWLKLN